MRPTRYALRITALFGFALLGTLSVSAADRTPARTVAQADPGSSDGSVNVFQQVTTDKAKLKYAEEAQDEMKEALLGLQKKIDDARKAKDIVFLNCLNEKYSSINALLQVTKTATELMQDALAQNNSQMADHQFRKVVIARLKVKQALQEVTECAGDSGSDPTVTEDVKVIVDSGLTEEPKVDLEPIDAITDPEPPPPQSN